MKKLLLSFACLLGIFSCTPEAEEPTPSEIQPQVNSFTDEVQETNGAAMGLGSTVQEIFQKITSPSFLEGRIGAEDCTNVAVSASGVAISFDEGCKLSTGQTLSGTINMTVALKVALTNGSTVDLSYKSSDMTSIAQAMTKDVLTVMVAGKPTEVPVSSIDATMSLTFSNFSVDGNTLQGSLSAQGQLAESDPQRLALSMTDMGIILSGQSESTVLSGQYNIDYSLGSQSDQTDDLVSMDGTFSGTTKDGYDFSGQITEDLQIKASCASGTQKTMASKGITSVTVDVSENATIKEVLRILKVSDTSSLSIVADFASDASGNSSNACDVYAKVTSPLGTEVMDLTKL